MGGRDFVFLFRAWLSRDGSVGVGVGDTERFLRQVFLEEEEGEVEEGGEVAAAYSHARSEHGGPRTAVVPPVRLPRAEWEGEP